MLTISPVSVLILSIYSALSPPVVHSSENRQNNNHDESKDPIAQLSQTDNSDRANTFNLLNTAYNKHAYRRRKRQISKLALGLLAKSRLLSGATRIASSGYLRRNFQKFGDFNTALKDFYSVEPVKVSTRTTDSGVVVVKGEAGDRVLSLRSHGSKGDPILDIVDYKSKHKGRYIDRIIYAKHSDN